jgi:hypothetical protein
MYFWNGLSGALMGTGAFLATQWYIKKEIHACANCTGVVANPEWGTLPPLLGPHIRPRLGMD